MTTATSAPHPDERTPLLRLTDIAKSFGPVTVLRGINLDVHAGEVLVLLGENGAGKSTLIKMVAGIYQPDAGTIELDGRPVHFKTIHQAEAAGISTIHQELNNVPQLSVAENILLGRLPTAGGLVRRNLVRARARQ
ncbi:MAG: ATP-binding cassette domain-containing protein, partial [Propionibacteriaceae bacterium]|nr:ATP-binding cassette domain-containing protein [Propionibacteriaceae bacterium]